MQLGACHHFAGTGHRKMTWVDKPGLAGFLRRVKISRSCSAQNAPGLIGGMVSSTPAQPKSTNVAQMRLLAESLSVAPFVLTALIIAYSISLTPFVPWTYVSIWTMAMLALQFINLRLSRSFLSLDAEEVIVDYWAPRFKANALAFSITLTSTLFVFWSPDNILHQNYLISTVAISFAPMMLVTVCYLPVAHRTIFPMLAGLILRFVSLGDMRHITIAIVLVIFGFLLHQLAVTINGAMSRSINLQSDKNALIEQLFRAKRESDAARARAEEANRAKSHFLANMSHELRTPLNAIIGFSEIMESNMFGPLGSARYTEYAKDIHDSGRHLLSVIDDILDIAKIEAGKYTVQIENVDIAAIIDWSVDMVRTRTNEKHQKITRHVPNSLPVLRADQRAMRQVVLNLLSNAMKFTPERGEIGIDVELGDQGEMRLTISDNGIGIPADKIDEVLQPFGQVDDAVSRQHGGTGLGLPITKSLIEMQGGQFQLESVLGKGTRAVMTWPTGRMIARSDSNARIAY